MITIADLVPFPASFNRMVEAMRAEHESVRGLHGEMGFSPETLGIPAIPAITDGGEIPVLLRNIEILGVEFQRPIEADEVLRYLAGALSRFCTNAGTVAARVYRLEPFADDPSIVGGEPIPVRVTFFRSTGAMRVEIAFRPEPHA